MPHVDSNFRVCFSVAVVTDIRTSKNFDPTTGCHNNTEFFPNPGAHVKFVWHMNANLLDHSVGYL